MVCCGTFVNFLIVPKRTWTEMEQGGGQGVLGDILGKFQATRLHSLIQIGFSVMYSQYPISAKIF